jgi:hypothetical protein
LPKSKDSRNHVMSSLQHSMVEPLDRQLLLNLWKAWIVPAADGDSMFLFRFHAATS